MNILAKFMATVAGLAIFAPQAWAADVTITRTALGVPHIKADDMYGAGVGVGYAYAQDNACLLLEEVVTLRGERSLYFGAENTVHDVFELSQQRYANLTSDTYYRYFMGPDMVAASRKGVSGDTADLIRGYVDGFNRFVRETPGALGKSCRGKAWVRDIAADDIHRRQMQFGLRAGANYFASGIAARPGGQSEGAASADALVPPLERLGLGSNMMAFGRDMTANGRGLHFSNPHFPWFGVERFYVQHVTVPGKLDVFGGALHGMPLPALGFNLSQAWSITWSIDQRFTLHELKLDEKDPFSYMLDGRSVPMRPRAIDVPVGGGHVHRQTVYETVFGPVIATDKLPWTRTTAYAIADINTRNFRLYDQLLSLGRSGTVRDVRDAVMHDMGLPYSNVISADSNGDTVYVNGSVAPNVPDSLISGCITSERARQWFAEWNYFMLDGSRSACRAQPSAGAPQPFIVPPSRRPAIDRNDYVLQSNDGFWVVNADPATRLTGFPRIIGIDVAALGDRTRRGLALAEERRAGRDGFPGNKMDADIFMKLFWRSPLVTAQRTLDDLVADCTANPSYRDDKGKSFDVSSACAVLAKWDRTEQLDSVGSHLFNRFLKQLPYVHSTVGFVLAPELWKHPFDPKDPLNTPYGMKVGETVRLALVAAIKELLAAGVPLDAPLREVQFVERGGKRLGLSGGPFGYNNLDTTLQPGKGLTEPVPFGNSYMHIVSFTGQGPVAKGILAYSQSADPDHAHGADMTEVYSRDAFIDLPMTADQINAARVGNPLVITLGERKAARSAGTRRRPVSSKKGSVK